MMKHLTDENNLYVKYFIPYTGVCSYAVAYPGFQRGGGGGLRSGLIRKAGGGGGGCAVHPRIQEFVMGGGRGGAVQPRIQICYGGGGGGGAVLPQKGSTPHLPCRAPPLR